MSYYFMTRLPYLLLVLTVTAVHHRLILIISYFKYLKRNLRNEILIKLLFIIRVGIPTFLQGKYLIESDEVLRNLVETKQ